MFQKDANGAVMIPHPNDIQKAIDAKSKEVKDLRRLQRVSFTAHGLPVPEKKAKKVNTPAAA